MKRNANESSIISNLPFCSWGRFADTSRDLSDVLLYVNVPVLDNTACSPFFGDAVTDKKICSSGANRLGPCGGDSGGPMVVTENGGRLVQVGLVSFSIGFGCQLGWPTVHTFVY